MYTSPAKENAEFRGTHRLLWLLVFTLLLIGALNISTSLLLPGVIQRWLHERGLEAQIEHLNVSLPRLRAHARGVQVRNASGRGFHVRDATLGLSWWDLLRGKIHVNFADVEGAYMDLVSEPGERGRVWEIGGWHLPEGPKRAKDWRVNLATTRVRNSVICYLNKPQWKTPSCARIGNLEVEHFFVSGHREGQEPLKFSIGAEDFLLENLLAWDEPTQHISGDSFQEDLPESLQESLQERARGLTRWLEKGDMRNAPEQSPNVAVVRLEARHTRFERPGNLLTTSEVFTRKFAGCSPKRWEQAVPGMGLLTGHCAMARRLQIKGPARFSFGKQSEIAWHRVDGQEVRLRYRNRRFPNWHAQSIAMNDFDFVRDAKTLRWQSGGATGFSWCPNPWRSNMHHYCIRAGSLRLPQPTNFDWSAGFNADLAEASLDRGSVVDLDAPTSQPDPLDVKDLKLALLQYRNSKRQFHLQQLSLNAASGCVPGQLWGREDHCVSLSQLQVPQDLMLQLARKSPRGSWPAQSWALQSGPFSLDKWQLSPGGEKKTGVTGASSAQPGDELALSALHWRRAELFPDKKNYLLEDFALQQLSGCVPDGIMPQRLSPLCIRAEQLQGQGDFVFAHSESPYLILGELGLESLLLSDHLAPGGTQQTGVALKQLKTGTGFFRIRSQQLRPGEYFASDDVQWWLSAPGSVPAGQQEADEIDGTEKGQLAQRIQSESERAGAPQSGETVSPASASPIGEKITARQTALELAYLSLTSVEGCLPMAWQALLVGRLGKRRPACFSVHNLRQHQPLNLLVEQQRDAEENVVDTDVNGSTEASVSSGKFRLAFTAADFTLESADVRSADKKPLLDVTALRLPKAAVRLQSAPARARVNVPGAALDKAAFCLQPERCVDIAMLRTGEKFSLNYDRERFTADLNDLVLKHFSLSGGHQQASAEIRQLVSLALKVNLPRKNGARADWQLQNLNAAVLDVCLPKRGAQGSTVSKSTAPKSSLPRCIRGRNLKSVGNGITVASLGLHRTLEEVPQVKLGQLHIEKLGLVQGHDSGHHNNNRPVQLNLHNISLDSVSGCGLKDWLAAARLRGASNGRWSGCLSTGPIHLSGDNLVSLGSKNNSAGNSNPVKLALGPLDAANLKLVPMAGKPVQLSSLQWQSFRWPGGARVQVENLQTKHFSGCLPGLVSAASGRSGQARKDSLCIDMGRLQIPGTQQLSWGAGLRASGRISVDDFALYNGGRQQLAFSNLGVSGLVFSPGAIALQRGVISGLSGCLSPLKLGGKPLRPCYTVGQITLESEHRLTLAQLKGSGEPHFFRNIRVDGLQVSRAGSVSNSPSNSLSGTPSGLPSPLLYIEHLQAEQLGYFRHQLVGKQLTLSNLRGCMPKGYVKSIQHCFNLAQILTTGRFNLERGRLDLAQTQLHQLAVDEIGGGEFLQAEFAELLHLSTSKAVIRLQTLNIANSKLFRRDAYAQEYAERPWNTEISLVTVNQFEYQPKKKTLDIDTIDLVKPRSILARGSEGDLGAWERFRSESPQPEHRKYLRGDIARRANRFKYRIRQIYVDRGRFLWLDESHKYHAKLPVRKINLLVQGASNHHEDAPASIIVSARPGGFSEMHLAGHINLLESNHWDAGILGYVEGANLIPATPYIAALLGYKILQGQLDAEINVQVADNQVDALAQMELQKIKVRRVRDTDHLEVKKSIIPLGFALALLKDGDGDVHFNMPVSGDLYDPEFSFGFIFSDLLQRAILEALFAYFTPIGFYSLAKLAWARFRAVSFSDLEFSPGSDALSEAVKVSLSGMVEKLRDNPKARPGICGVATARDLEAMFPHEVGAVSGVREQRDNFYRDPPRGIREELLHLSNKRSRHVQKYLIEAGLDQEDFIQCAPDYVGKDFGAPRVELSN